ncbi:MAG: ATP-binding cassette domain-containing protein, partial [Litorivicinus sp.]
RSRSPLNFNIPSSDKLSTPLVAGSDLTLGYPNADIISGAHLSLNPGDRVGLLGVNGAGKSTLVKTLVGQLKPKAGTLHPGQNTRMGYFAQEQLDTLRADSVPLAELMRIAPTARELELRNFLGGWGFGAERIDQPITALSGGERARLALALIAWQKPNLLILDEPTNHLDLDARAALAEALVEFSGALLLVSHDRHLLETTCDQLWSLRRGTLGVWTQALEDWVDDSPATESEAAKSDSSLKEQRRNRAAQRTQLAPLRKVVKQCETRMESLQSDIEAIDQRQAQPGYFTDTPVEEQTRDGQARAALVDALESAEMEWLEASEALESASTSPTAS